MCAILLAAGFGGEATGAGAAGAQTRPAGHSRLLEKLTNCAEVSDRDARLGCYEAAAAELKAAEARGDIVMVDREQAQAVRRQAFGFELPSLSLFDRGGRAEKLDRVSGRLAGASRDGGGRWTFQLEDGATWTQVDSDPLLVTPRAGMPVEVKTSLLGAYFLDVDGHAGVRVRRVR